MITDRSLCDLAAAIYAAPSSTQWDHYYSGIDDDVCWGAKSLGNVLAVIYRGSSDLEDWYHDVSALPTYTMALGAVHWGFNVGVYRAAGEALTLANGRPVIVAGHSLGAAHATLAAGYMMAAGHAPIARVVWGEPISGFAKLAGIVGAIKQNRSYRNTYGGRVDPVTLVPLAFGPFKYQRVVTPINVSAKPSDGGLFGLHHIELYQSATPSTAIVT